MKTDACSMAGSEEGVEIRNRPCMCLWLNPLPLLEPIFSSIPRIMSKSVKVCSDKILIQTSLIH